MVLCIVLWDSVLRQSGFGEPVSLDLHRNRITVPGQSLELIGCCRGRPSELRLGRRISNKLCREMELQTCRNETTLARGSDRCHRLHFRISDANAVLPVARAVSQ